MGFEGKAWARARAGARSAAARAMRWVVFIGSLGKAAGAAGQTARIAARKRPAKPLEGIDTHAHVFSASAPTVAGARYRPAYAATLEAWRALREPLGLTHGVVVQVSFYGTDNTEVLAAVARDPARLKGVAIVDPSFDESRLAALHEGGIRAMRLNLKSVADYRPYADAAWKALYGRVHALGWIEFIYVNTAKGRPVKYDEAMQRFFGQINTAKPWGGENFSARIKELQKLNRRELRPA